MSGTTTRPFYYGYSPTGVIEPEDWKALVDMYNGFTVDGYFRCAYNFIVEPIVDDGTTYYQAVNAYQRIYGGPDDTGGIDGTSKADVQQACATALASSGGSILLKENQLDGSVTYASTILIVEDYQGTRKFYGTVNLPAGTVSASDLDVELQAPFKFIVRVNSGKYEALDSQGTLTYGGASDAGSIDGDDASAVIMACVGALTASRNNIEWLKLIGEFTLNKYSTNDYCIKITTLTGLDLTSAYLTLADSQNCPLIHVESSGNPQEHSWIKGGILDGNSAGQTSAGVGIKVYNGSHNILENVTVRDCYGHGFQFTGDGLAWAGLHRIDGCRSYYNGGSGFVTNLQSDNYFYGCVAQNNTVNGFWFIYPQHATRCHSIYNQTGFLIASHCHLTDCYADTNNHYGFYVYSATETIYQVFLNNCYSYRNSQTTDNTYDNFYIQDVDDVQLVNCRAKPKASAPADAKNARYGFYLNNCDNASLTNCTAQKHATHGFYILNSNGVSLTGCQGMDNVQHGFRIESSNNCTATGCVGSLNGYNGLSAYITSYLSINGGSYYGNDSGDTATYHGVSLNGDSNYCVINGVTAYGNDAYQIAILAAACDNCTVTNCTMEATDCTGTLTNSGTNCIIRNNQGYVTENYGTATINSGDTTVTITHGLSITPASGDINITLREQATNDPGDIWITNITSTQFTVNVRADPGASNLDIGWSVKHT